MGDNNEYCEVCQLPGYLVECESCPRSFHHICLNDSKLGKHFKCPFCRPTFVPLIKNRFFSDLLRIPTLQSFKLPDYIQKLTKIEQWGVVDGPNTPKMTPDDFTMCYACSCGGDPVVRRMIQCKSCKDWYHHDCVTPPIVMEPVHWICPKHCTHIMTEKYSTQMPEFNSSDLIPVQQRPGENPEIMREFGIVQPLLLPAEAIKRQFVEKVRKEGKNIQLLSNQDLALSYLKSIEQFTENAIETIKNRFCLDDVHLERNFRKLEELRALIEVLFSYLGIGSS